CSYFYTAPATPDIYTLSLHDALPILKNIESSSYKVRKEIQLSTLSTKGDLDASDKKLKKALENIRVELGEFQDTLYAHAQYSVLICLQGMDTAGKDSLIRE